MRDQAEALHANADSFDAVLFFFLLLFGFLIHFFSL